MIIKVSTIIMLILTSVLSCSKNAVESQGKNPMPQKTVKDVLKEHTSELMSLPGVVGTAEALCDGKPCIKIYVHKRSPELDRQIPAVLEGYPVVIEETGAIHTLPENREKGK